MITASRHGLTLAAHRVFLAGTAIGLVALLSSLWTMLMLSPLQAWAPGWCSWDSDLGRAFKGVRADCSAYPTLFCSSSLPISTWRSPWFGVGVGVSSGPED